MTNPFQNMIVAAVDQKPDDFTQEFNAAIQEKLQAHITNYKAFLVATLLGDEPVTEEDKTMDEGEATDIIEVFDLFMDDHDNQYENLKDAVTAFAKEVQLSEEEAQEFYEYLIEEDETLNERTGRGSGKALSTKANKEADAAAAKRQIAAKLRKNYPGKHTGMIPHSGPGYKPTKGGARSQVK